MRIIAFGDIHMEIGTLDRIKDMQSADYIIITGDITNFGYRSDAKNVLDNLLAVNSNILAVAGNLDQPDVAHYLEETGISLHGRGMFIDNLGLVGLGGSNYTPFHTPYEFSEKKLADLLGKGIAQIGEKRDHILVSHTPPHKTAADKLLNGDHVGSTAVRKYIERYQPLLCLTGHIHESRGQDTIGRTRILNPGMIKNGGYIEVHYNNGRISAALNA
jgi:Icc-related predicted phosphoesterase